MTDVIVDRSASKPVKEGFFLTAHGFPGRPQIVNNPVACVANDILWLFCNTGARA